MTVTPSAPRENTPNPNPAQMHDLSRGEVLLIRSLRRWALAVADDKPRHFQALIRDFCEAVPDAHGDALSATIRLLRAVAKGAGRTIHHHQPDCPCFCADEIALVTLVAALQAAEPSLARKLAGWLVEEGHVADVLTAARRVSTILHDNDIRIPLRQSGRGESWRNAARITHAASTTIH